MRRGEQQAWAFSASSASPREFSCSPQFSGEGLVQERLFQRGQRGELLLVKAGEALGLVVEGVETIRNLPLLFEGRQRNWQFRKFGLVDIADICATAISRESVTRGTRLHKVEQEPRVDYAGVKANSNSEAGKRSHSIHVWNEHAATDQIFAAVGSHSQNVVASDQVVLGEFAINGNGLKCLDIFR
jgi:hypothetical protein